jgi:membrane-associated phospholipid phosphatase
MNDKGSNAAKGKFTDDVPPRRHPIRYGLLGLAVVIAFAAVLVWPFDEMLSDMLCISRVGHVATPLWWEALKGVRVFGKAEILFVLGFLLAIHRRKQVAVSACIAVLLAGLIVTPMKLVIARPRPDGSNMMSFPSGDTASLTAFLVPIASAIPAVRPIALAGVAAVGAVRVSNGFHFPSDILVGVAIGIVAGAIALSVKSSLKPQVRRLLRRSWLAAALGIFFIIHFFLPAVGNFRTFFSIFGPSVVLLAVAPFIRARLRTKRAVSRSLLFGTIYSLGGIAAVASSWFVVALVPALGVGLPGIDAPADPGPVWAIIGLGCVLLVMSLFALKEYGAKRYRSTLGILAAGVVCLCLTILVFVAWHGWTVQGFETAD